MQEVEQHRSSCRGRSAAVSGLSEFSIFDHLNDRFGGKLPVTMQTEMGLRSGAVVDGGLGDLVVMPDLDDVAIWVAKVLRAFGQTLGSERPFTFWREVYSPCNQSSGKR